MSEMSIASNDSIDSNAKRRAQIRRHKIMSQSDNRIKKILSSNVKHNTDVTEELTRHDSTHDKTDNQWQHNSSYDSMNGQLLQQNCDQNDLQYNNKSSETLIESSVRHRFNQSLNGLDSQSFESSAEEPSMDRTFPRKVSLISTPIDYKTLQQSHRNNTISVMSHLVWILWQNQTKISVLSVLIVVAIVGSALKLNFVLPFFVTQLFRLLIVYRNQRNNASNNSMTNNISILVSVSQQLTIFVFTYIVVQLFI